jgi:pyruvate/2-oxoglutarate dehydrogenase complex dihydrolipoamide dehydrogenase (E3) component
MKFLQRRVDYNVICIGGGSAGLVSAYIGTTLRGKIALIEKNKMGGDCLNTGCVPSKAFIKTAKIASYQFRAEEFGLESVKVEIDFAKVMDRVRRVIESISPNDSIERYQSLGVNCIQGTAKILSPKEVLVNDTVIRTNSIVIATGARPFVPPIPGIREIPYVTSDNVWNLRSLPTRLLVLGGGVIGCEMAQAFQRLGAKVTILERNPRLLPREDEDVSKKIHEKFSREGISIILGKQLVEFKKLEETNIAICDDQQKIEFDTVFIALGRKANTEGLGLSEVGVRLNKDGSVYVSAKMQTTRRGIFACGDVVGMQQFTHFASLSATTAITNALISPIRTKLELTAFPYVTFTDPEIARVGLNESEAISKKINYEKSVIAFSHSDRSKTEEETEGFIKVLTAPNSDKILGATIVGSAAGEIIQELAFAMKNSLGLNSILKMVHSYPTLNELNRMIASEWKKKRIPVSALSILQKIFQFRRRFGI